MAVAVHFIECCWCHSDLIVPEQNSEHFKCRSCGTRFWHQKAA